MRASLRFVFIALYVIQISSAHAQGYDRANRKFPADTVKAAISGIEKELSLKHPGFYRYHDKAAFTRYIDSVKATIHDSLTEMESFLKLKPVVSRIGCLHTGLSLSDEYRAYLNPQANLFPFKVYFKDHEAYVVKSYSASTSIKPGDKIVSINGRSIDSIMGQLLPLIPSDGYNTSMKYRALFYQFPSWYRMVDPTEDFSVITEENGKKIKHQVKGKRFDDIAEDGFLKEPKREKQLAFRIENNIGILTIHSFAKSDMKRVKQDFRPFIKEAFATLKKQKITSLVLDLRDNTGGSDQYAAFLASHFFDAPFRYWDRIEVTEAIAKEIKGFALKVFYRKPVQHNSTWLWQKSRLVRDFDFYETQQPAKNYFKGEVYVLVNGFCMSSCADVAAILSHNKKATFVGEETGGGYQGNNSGIMPATKWLPFNFRLTVPLQKYVNFVDTSKNFGRGTMPEYPVSYGIDDLLKTDDKALMISFDLIKRSRENSKLLKRNY
jgi:hypothetical protein